MKKIMLLVLLFAGCTLLCGCAEMIKESCTVNAAYSSGVNDGQDRQPMRDYGILCPKPDQGRINDAYQRGYRYGVRHRRHRPMPPPPPRPYPHHHRYY